MLLGQFVAQTSFTPLSFCFSALSQKEPAERAKRQLEASGTTEIASTCVLPLNTSIRT